MTGSPARDQAGHAAPEGLIFSQGPPDPDQQLRLFESTGWNATYRCGRDDLARAATASWKVICAHQGEELVGMIRVVSDGVLYAVVFDLIVASEWRGRGVGRALLERAVLAAEAAGIRDVLLFAARGTAPFYQAAGFSPRPGDAPGMIMRLAER